MNFMIVVLVEKWMRLNMIHIMEECCEHLEKLFFTLMHCIFNLGIVTLSSYLISVSLVLM